MKRYIMLTNNEIVDTKGDNNYKIYEDTLWHNSMVKSVIKQQSDNILDLLEVGDMVEFTSGYIKNLSTNSNIRFINLSDSFRKDIIAIWKRSGDIMRRYEV